ncbi:MAG: 30S ribosomal protein S20 [Spirochaetes bacterium]|nr:MAG: 30S ribosomal protein S20 [Spirochaetota bacterium]
MATHKSAIKRARQNQKRNLRNRMWKSRIKTYKNKLEKAIQEQNAELIDQFMREYKSVIDKAALRGVIHKNTASRKKKKMINRIRTSAK